MSIHKCYEIKDETIEHVPLIDIRMDMFEKTVS